MEKKYLDWLIFGAATGLILSVVAPAIIAWIVGQTGVTGITFATLNVRSQFKLLADQGNAFYSLLTNWIGFGVTLPGVLMSMIGLGVGAALVRWLLDLVKIEIPSKFRIVGVMLIAHLIMGIVISKALPAFEIVPMAFLVLGGLGAAYLMELLYKKVLKMPLPQ